jgi:hypothetical protein
MGMRTGTLAEDERSHKLEGCGFKERADVNGLAGVEFREECRDVRVDF